MGSDVLHQVSCLRFVPVVERIVEAEHSLLHRYGGYRKVTGAFVSCALRLAEVDECMASNDGKQMLFRAFARARKLRTMAHLFGFSQHPEWLRITSKPRREQTGLEKAVNAIMYGNDVSLLYLDLGGPKQQNRKRKNKEQNERRALLMNVNPRQPLTQNAVVNSAFALDLSQQLVPGNFYSMSVEYSQQQSAVKSLDQAQRLPTAEVDGEELKNLPATAGAQLCVQLDESALEAVRAGGHAQAQAGREDAAKDHVFFKVLTSRASALKTVRGAAAGKQRLRRGDITVTFHKGSYDEQQGAFVLQAQPSRCSESGSVIHVLTSAGASVGNMTQMLRWNRSKQPVLSLPGVTSRAAADLLQRLLDAKAIEGSDMPSFPGSLLDGSLEPELAELGQKGWLLETPSGWRLSLAALQQMSVGQVVSQPSLVAGLPNEDLPLADFSTFQLCKHLESAGWTWQRLSKRSSPYRLGAPKLFYSSGLVIKREYLLSLALANDMFETRNDVRIAHGQPLKYYRLLLDWDFVAGLHSF